VRAISFSVGERKLMEHFFVKRGEMKKFMYALPPLKKGA
jgi:hypothetical protein